MAENLEKKRQAGPLIREGIKSIIVNSLFSTCSIF